MKATRYVGNGAYGVRLLLSLIACSTNLARAASDICYYAEGTVDYENYIKGEPMRLPRVNFSVSVSNACWLIRTTPTAEDAYEYQEAAFDGHDLYHLTRLHFAGSSGSERRTSITNVATAHIYNTQRIVTSLFAHQMGPIWLMLGSAEYWRNRTNGLAEPVVTFGLFEIEDYYERPFMQVAHWTLSEDFPHLPLTADYLDDGEIKGPAGFAPARRRAPFDAGFTNVSYRVLALTNHDGVTLPSLAELSTFRPSPKTRAELVHFTGYRLALTGCSRGARVVAFQPTLPGLTVVSDTRVHDLVGGVTYLATNGWPSLKRVTNSSPFKQQLHRISLARASSSGEPSASNAKRIAFVRLGLVLSVLVATALVFATLHKWKAMH